MKKIGVIGGSGLENLSLSERNKEIQVETPYGDPSSTILKMEINSSELYIISRHGRQHTITPTNVNNRANIYALKQAGCEVILATTACGSLREEIKRGDIVFPDQFIDFTRHRVNTFSDEFEPSLPVHTAMAEPFSRELREIMIQTAKEKGLRHHASGTVITIEGPRFSTRAESHMFRILGGDIINMSVAPEAALACEAGLKYAVVALSTDYDCWKTDEEPVTWNEVFRVFQENLKKVTELLVEVIRKI